MTEENAEEAYSCNSCGTTVENTAVTGILCMSCFEEQNAPPSAGWRDYLTGPSATGAAVGSVSYFVHFTVNGVDFIAAVGGSIALICGVLGLAVASKRGPSGKKAMIGSGLVILLGLYQLMRSQLWLLLS